MVFVVTVVPMMSVVPRCLWWSRVSMVSVVVCGALWWSMVPMVSVLPTVSMTSVVPYGVCGVYGVCSAYVAL